MSAAMAAAGWALAAVAAAAASLAVARLRQQAARVARAAHELRGGLAVAGLALERAARRDDAVDAARAQLARAGRALDELERARAAGEEWFDLGAMLRAVTAAWPAVDVDARPVRVRGDRGALTQACANLVANAVEHGLAPVRVCGGAARGVARVEVHDGGRGPRLDARVRAGAARRGHGLAIAAEAAERHGGTLSADRGDAGTRVVLAWPSPAREPAPTAEPGARP